MVFVIRTDLLYPVTQIAVLFLVSIFVLLVPLTGTEYQYFIIGVIVGLIIPLLLIIQKRRVSITALGIVLAIFLSLSLFFTFC